MQVKCFKAIISVLSGKLNNDNVQLRDYKVEQGRYEGRIAVLERKLGEQVERVRLTAELAAEKTGTDIDGIPAILTGMVQKSLLYIVTGSSVFEPNSNATVGEVGVINASKLLKMLSNSLFIILRTFKALR